MSPHIPFKISLIDNKPTFIVENLAIKSFNIKKMLLHDISENTIQRDEPLQSLKDYTFRLKHLEVNFNLMTIKRIMDNDLFTLHRIATHEGYLVFSGKYRHENNYIDISFKCFYYPFVGTKFYFVPEEFFIFSNIPLFPYSIFTNIFLPQKKYWETLSSSYLTFDPMHLFLRQLPFLIHIPNSNNLELHVNDDEMKLCFKEHCDEEATGRLNIQFLREIKSRLAHTEIEEKLLKNNFTEAKTALEKLHEKDSEDLYALERIMYIDLSMSNLSEAIETAEALEAKSPKNTKSLTILGLAYLQKRNIEKSHFYFNQLKEIFRSTGNTFCIDELNRFLAFMSSDQNRLRVLAHDISSETKDSLKSSLLLEEAEMYLKNNEIEKANICIHNALDLEINNYSTAANLIEKSRSQEAKDLFRNLNNIFSLGEPLHQGTLFDTAYELGKNGNYDEALSVLTTLLSFDENEIVALLYKGILLLKQQKNEEAKSVFQKLYALQSKQNYFLSRDMLLSKIDPSNKITKRNEKS